MYALCSLICFPTMHARLCLMLVRHLKNVFDAVLKDALASFMVWIY